MPKEEQDSLPISLGIRDLGQLRKGAADVEGLERRAYAEEDAR